MTFERLLSAHPWKPIAHCPGRYALASRPDLSPRDLVGPEVELREHRTRLARDLVVVGTLADGGVISYQRADGSCLHTLNTVEGFERKLQQLGLSIGAPRER